MKRAFLVMDKQLTQEIKSILILGNYQVVAATDNGMEALRLIHRFEPDLIIMGWRIKGLQSFDFLHTLNVQNICPVIVLLMPEENNKIQEVIQYGAQQLVLYPMRAVDLLAAVFTAESRFSFERDQNERIKQLEEEIKSRKIIYQALLIIIKLFDYDEDSAYTALRKYAMESRKSMKSAATDIIKGIWLPK